MTDQEVADFLASVARGRLGVHQRQPAARPTDQGGHGGMAIREQEARIYEEQTDTEPSE